MVRNTWLKKSHAFLLMAKDKSLLLNREYGNLNGMLISFHRVPKLSTISSRVSLNISQSHF